MFLLAEFCQKSGVLQALYIVKMVIKILSVLAPIFIILSGMKTLFGVVVNDDKTGDAVKSIITKIVIAAFIFFIPNIVTTVIGFATKEDMSCIDAATPEKIEYYQNKEKQESTKKIQEKKQQAEKNKQAAKSQDKKEKETAKKAQEELDKKKEAAGQNNTSSGSTSTGNTGTNIPTTRTVTNTSGISGTLFVGDSRTVGMYFSTHSGSYSSSINLTSGNEAWLAKVSMGYSWFKSTAISYIKGYVSKGNYNVTIQMGANDLYNSNIATSYVSQIKELASAYPNSNFVIISVNPINDAKASSVGYSCTNAQAIAFNNKYKSAIASSGLSNISYCDTYSAIINNYSTSDGLHYGNSTNKVIYENIKGCL